MQVTLTGNVLRIQWPEQWSAKTQAEIVRRLEQIETALKSNRPCVWYVHRPHLDTVMDQFPGASYSPEVWAQWKPK